MTVRSALLVLVASTPLTQLGCDSGLQDRLYQARDQRFEAAKQAVFGIEASRNEALKAAVPAPDAKPVGDDHPMMAWRKSVAQREDADMLKVLSSHAKLLQPTTAMLTQSEVDELVAEEGATPGKPYREGWYQCTISAQADAKGLYQKNCESDAKVMAMGTPAQSAADVGASFLRDVNEYWTSKTSLSRYLNAIQSFEVMASQAKAKADELAKQDPSWQHVETPFVDEANFDKWFVHAASMLQLSSLPDRNVAWNAMHPDYGVVFGMARRAGEGASDYVSRLCFAYDGLKGKCSGIPHEYRAAVVDRAFLAAMRDKAAAYKHTTVRGQVFKDIADSFVKSMDEAMAKSDELAKGFVETMVLPSTFAPVGGFSGVRVMFSQDGITALTDKEVKLLDKYTAGNLPKTLQADVVKLLSELRDQPGNRIDYQRIVLEMPGNTTIPAFIEGVRLFPSLLGEAAGIKDIFLVGRRRVDDSMRLASLKLRIPRADDSPVITYQFKEDAAKLSCQLLGQVGTPPAGKKNEFFLEVGPTKIRAAALTINEETGERTPGDTIDLGTPADLSAVHKWIEENPGRMRAFVKVGGDYDKMLSLLTSILYKCTDEEIAFDDATKAPLKRTCGKSEERAVTFVLGLCD